MDTIKARIFATNAKLKTLIGEKQQGEQILQACREQIAKINGQQYRVQQKMKKIGEQMAFEQEYLRRLRDMKAEMEKKHQASKQARGGRGQVSDEARGRGQDQDREEEGLPYYCGTFLFFIVWNLSQGWE